MPKPEQSSTLSGTCSTILAFHHSGRSSLAVSKSDRQVDPEHRRLKQYRTMSLEEICDVGLRDVLPGLRDSEQPELQSLSEPLSHSLHPTCISAFHVAGLRMRIRIIQSLGLRGERNNMLTLRQLLIR